MVQLMLVDDEMFEIDGIRATVNFERLGISRVFEANSMKQAKEIFMGQHIDILICDIEMPQGSGLELLAWVREHHPKTECIFLTCHADFAYARQAIQLGSLDYLLKPAQVCDIENVILKAIEKINKESENIERTRFSKLWLKHKPLIIERFWLDIISQKIPQDRVEIKRAAADINLPGLQDMQILPILINVQRWHNKMDSFDEKLMEFALKNVAEELIIKNQEDGIIIEIGKGTFLGILYLDAYTRKNIEELKEDCTNYVSSCNKHLCCDLSCYIGKSVFEHELVEMVNRLILMEKDNVSQNNAVILFNQKQSDAINIVLPNMYSWLVMLDEKQKNRVLNEVKEFLGTADYKKLNAQVLYQFQQDFLQMIYAFLKQKGVLAHQLLSDSYSAELLEHASSSVNNMMDWVEHITVKALDYAAELEKTQSVTDKVKSFIKLNIEKELTNEEIANQVYLNQVYLNRIFKRDTGQSLSEFVINERFKIAKELLAKTDLPISTVAANIGYTNFSHFSRLFRKYIGISPVEYRKKCNNAK